MSTECDLEVSSQGHLFRAGRRAQNRQFGFCHRQRVGTNRKKRREGPKENEAAKTQQQRAAPADRLARLFLLEEIDHTEVEAVTDDRGWRGLFHRRPAITRRVPPDLRVEPFL